MNLNSEFLKLLPHSRNTLGIDPANYFSVVGERVFYLKVFIGAADFHNPGLFLVDMDAQLLCDLPITPAMFAGNCSPVVISDGENEETHDNMKLIQITHVDEEYWFVLLDVPESELRRLKMQSDLEYLAMMTGVEL